MATHRLPILTNLEPDASGDVYRTPGTLLAGFTNFKRGVWVFKDTSTKVILSGAFFVPSTYVATSATAFIAKWVSDNDVIAGDVVWDLDYRTVAVGESEDQVLNEQTLTVTDAAPGTADLQQEVTIGNATEANFAGGQEVQFDISRDGAVGGPTDDMVANAVLIGLFFVWADA